MATQLIQTLRHLTFSRLEGPPDNGETITNNGVRISIWGSLGTGTTAIISMYSRKVISERAMKMVASHVFKASLASSLTCVLIAGCFLYKMFFVEVRGWRESQEDLSLFQRTLTVVSFSGVLAVFLAHYFLKPDHALNIIAGNSIIPLASIGITEFALWRYHREHCKNFYPGFLK